MSDKWMGGWKSALQRGDGWRISWTSVILGATLLVIFWMKRDRRKLPPGPWSWPIVGNLFLLGTVPHQSLTALAKKYGPLFLMHFGSLPVLVVSDAEMAKEYFKVDAIFANRPHSTILKTLKECRYQGIRDWSFGTSSYGAPIMEVRKVCKADLFNSGKVKALGDMRKEEIAEAVGSIYNMAQLGKLVDLRSILHTLTMNNMCRLLFGNRLSDPGNKHMLEKFKFVFSQVVELGQTVNIGDMIPVLRPFDLQGLRSGYRKVKPQVDELNENILEECRKPSEKATTTGIVDTLLSLDGENRLSDTCISSILFELIAAGKDTTAATLEYIFAELIRHPSMMHKLQTEVDNIVGVERSAEDTDGSNMPYLLAVIKETLRLHPVLPLALPHMNEKETSVFGYTIPTNTTVLLNIWAINTDPTMWSNPFEFLPERFLGSDVNVIGNSHFFPFSNGRRACLGTTLAMSTLPHIVASLVHAFNWTPPPGIAPHEIDVTEGPGYVTQCKTSPIATATPRFPAIKSYCSLASA